MRKISIMGLLMGANFATAGLGQYVDGEGGKLAISNLTPVLFLLFSAPVFLIDRKSINRNVAALLLGFNAFAWLSFMIFAFRYNWDPNVAVLGFQEVEIVFSLLMIWYSRNNFDEFRIVARYGTLVSAVLSAWYGVHAVMGGSAIFVTFGMDDKSQAAVLFCCQAFILIRYFGRPLDYLVAGLLVIFSFITLSRLPVFFLPILMLTVAGRSRYGSIVVAVAGVVVVAVAVAFGDVISQLFKVFDRLASLDAIEGDGATSAHLLLLQTALDMKFTDALTFIFGSGPGNFAKALSSFPLSLQQLNSVDPTLIYEARLNRAPMHSTPFSALLDYNILIFCLLGFFLVRATRYLLRGRHYMELGFFGSLLAASMFYSLHNKPYLFLMVTTIYVFMSVSERSVDDTIRSRAWRPGYVGVLAPGHQAK